MDVGLNSSLALMVVCTVSLLFFSFVLSFVSLSWRKSCTCFLEDQKNISCFFIIAFSSLLFSFSFGKGRGVMEFLSSKSFTL